MKAKPLSSKVIEELGKRVMDTVSAVGDMEVNKDARLNPMRVAREDRQAGITDLNFLGEPCIHIGRDSLHSGGQYA